MKQEKRLVTYVTGDIVDKVKAEAKKLGMTESTYIRFVLIQFLSKKANKHETSK